MKEFINELKENRIELWVEEGKLHYKSPKGAMTKEIIDKIKGNKDEIINFLYNDICLRLERTMIRKGGINNALAEHDLLNNTVVLYLEPEDSKSTIENYYIDKIAIACEECWERETLKLNRTLLQEWIDSAEQVALGEMFKLFLEHDIFVSTETIYTYDIIENKLGVTDKYKRFLRRWLKIFEKEGYIVYSETGYVCIKQDNPKVQELWKTYWSKENKLNYGKEFVDYLEKCSKNLSNLFSGQVTPLELLFPQGKSDVAVGTYQNTLSSKILNHMAEDAILSSYMYRKDINEIFRILEVGAGVGGTSDGVIEKLDGKNVEYYYTDVSNYFLNNARKRYEGKDWIQYQIFDINKGNTEDTMYDLILCANVLHNAKNGIEILTMLKSKLKDEGIMVIIDAIKEPYYLLTSIEFNDGLRDFEDFRNYNFDDMYVNAYADDIILEKVFGRLIGSDVEKMGYTINDYALKKEIDDIIRENGGGFDHELLGKTERAIDKQYNELLKYSQKERLRKLYLSSNMKSSEIADNQIIDIYQIFKHNFIAAIYYKPNLYNGDVSILKCDTETDNFFINIIEKFSESEDVWNNSLTGEVSVFVIKGNHITCMEQPNIKRNINYIIGENSD